MWAIANLRGKLLLYSRKFRRPSRRLNQSCYFLFAILYSDQNVKPVKRNRGELLRLELGISVTGGAGRRELEKAKTQLFRGKLEYQIKETV